MTIEMVIRSVVEGSNEDYFGCIPPLLVFSPTTYTAVQVAVIVHAVCFPSKISLHPEFYKTAFSILWIRALTAARPRLPLSHCPSWPFLFFVS